MRIELPRQPAGTWDLYAAIDKPVDVGGARLRVPTGWAFSVPEGFEVQAISRSELALVELRKNRSFYYCPEQHTTFGLLPDFHASRVPGTLDDIERTAAQAEVSAGLEHAAEELRPGDEPGAVTLSVAVAWVRLRVAWVRALLITVAGLSPELFAGVKPSVERSGPTVTVVTVGIFRYT